MLDYWGLVGCDGGMRVNRSVVVDGGRSQYFHVISRVVDRRLVFGEVEKSMFVRMMRRQSAFSGVEVLAYCVMGNHFHLLLHVPERRAEISEEELWSRMSHIYSAAAVEGMKIELEERKEAGDEAFVREFRGRIGRRLFDLSAYVKELKLRFSKWFNRERERKGTLWEERFRAVLVEGNEGALLRTAAYIEFNPVRAGIVGDPEDYVWNSVSEAAAGHQAAVRGVEKLLAGHGFGPGREGAVDGYLQFIRGGVQAGDQISENESSTEAGCVPVTGVRDTVRLMGRRIRSFSEGLVLGSREFVQEFYRSRCGQLNPRRSRVSHRVGAFGASDPIYSYRRVPDREAGRGAA